MNIKVSKTKSNLLEKEKHLGNVVKSFRGTEFKITTWIDEQLKLSSKIAESEPQNTYCIPAYMDLQ